MNDVKVICRLFNMTVRKNLLLKTLNIQIKKYQNTKRQ